MTGGTMLTRRAMRSRPARAVVAAAIGVVLVAGACSKTEQSACENKKSVDAALQQLRDTDYDTDSPAALRGRLADLNRTITDLRAVAKGPETAESKALDADTQSLIEQLNAAEGETTISYRQLVQGAVDKIVTQATAVSDAQKVSC